VLAARSTDNTVPDIVAAGIRLSPAVRAARDDAEQTRKTPPALAAEIGKAGIYQMYLPHSMGGSETPPLTAWSRNCRKPTDR
jgi:alkylation response protein AidB-like acyl-CoA dehydrogenase